MKDWKEILEKYLEEGKLPLIDSVFTRKVEVGETLKKLRQESRLTQTEKKNRLFRKNMLYWSAAAMFAILLGIALIFCPKKNNLRAQ